MKLNCYHCSKRLAGFPQLLLSLIGATKKDIKKDYFDFCPECFEYLFGTVVFSTEKIVAFSCHVCESTLIESVPYAYFTEFYKLQNGASGVGKRRVCGSCTQRDLFPIINSILIIKP